MSSPLEMTELYDNALLGILQHVGNIQNFLQVYFGFLYRKTDFYRLLTGPQDRMGFPPGVAEKMAFKVLTDFCFDPLNWLDNLEININVAVPWCSDGISWEYHGTELLLLLGLSV